MIDLKPCPCGKVPERLLITGAERSRWREVDGDCCGHWMLEFRSDYLADDDPELMERAIEAWNSAPRAGVTAEKEIKT